jgi:hypothetical protein
MEAPTVGTIRRHSTGEHRWTVAEAGGQLRHYSTDTYGRGLYRDGVEVLPMEGFHLEGYSFQGRRAKVLRVLATL